MLSASWLSGLVCQLLQHLYIKRVWAPTAAIHLLRCRAVLAVTFRFLVSHLSLSFFPTGHPPTFPSRCSCTAVRTGIVPVSRLHSFSFPLLARAPSFSLSLAHLAPAPHLGQEMCLPAACTAPCHCLSRLSRRFGILFHNFSGSYPIVGFLAHFLSSHFHFLRRAGPVPGLIDRFLHRAFHGYPLCSRFLSLLLLSLFPLALVVSTGFRCPYWLSFGELQCLSC